MKNLLFLFVIFSFLTFGNLFSQDVVNNPNTIFEFIKKSPIMYKGSELKDTILPADRSNNLVDNKYKRIKDSTKFNIKEYDPAIFNDKIYLDAENSYNSGNFSESLILYKELYQKYPDFSKAVTMQGICLIKVGNPDEAVEILRDAVSENFIDFKAHEMLSDIYDGMGLTDVAIRHILYAHILNRNDVEINKKRINLFKKKGLTISDWVFVPQVKYEASKKDVEYFCKPQYEGYAMVEALWNYDEDYRKTKHNLDAKFNFNKLQECMYGQLIAFQTCPWYAATEEGKIIKKTLETRKNNEFIYYEIILPEFPDEAMKLSDNIINKIVDYVMVVRGEIK